MHHIMSLVDCSLPGYAQTDVPTLGAVGMGSPSFVPESKAVLEAPQPVLRVVCGQHRVVSSCMHTRASLSSWI